MKPPSTREILQAVAADDDVSEVVVAIGFSPARPLTSGSHRQSGPPPRVAGCQTGRKNRIFGRWPYGVAGHFGNFAAQMFPVISCIANTSWSRATEIFAQLFEVSMIERRAR